MLSADHYATHCARGRAEVRFSYPRRVAKILCSPEKKTEVRKTRHVARASKEVSYPLRKGIRGLPSAPFELTGPPVSPSLHFKKERDTDI